LNDLLKKRRSIRKFKQQPVAPDLIDKLARAALMSPSSRKINPWEFIIVTDPELISKLSACKEHGSAFLKGAPLGIVVIADETKSDVWVEDTSIASVIIQLTAEDLGLGSCWIQVRKRMKDSSTTSEDYVRSVLGLPGNYKVASVIAIGYPAETRPPCDENELLYEKLHSNKFGNCMKL